MPIEQVVKHTCARCKKVSYIAADSVDKKMEEALSVMFSPGGTTDPQEQITMRFDVLCESCTSTVANYLAHIRKEPKKKEAPEPKESGAKEEGTKASTSSKRATLVASSVHSLSD